MCLHERNGFEKEKFPHIVPISIGRRLFVCSESKHLAAAPTPREAEQNTEAEMESVGRNKHVFMCLESTPRERGFQRLNNGLRRIPLLLLPRVKDP